MSWRVRLFEGMTDLIVRRSRDLHLKSEKKSRIHNSTMRMMMKSASLFTSQRRPKRSVQTLLLWFWISPVIAFGLQGRQIVQHLRSSSWSSAQSSSTSLQAGTDDDESSSSLRRSRRRVQKEITLYDILGASPKDTNDQLRLRYTSLVKRLHPDTNPKGGSSIFIGETQYDLSEINAAWEILSDKKERQRYDRELQAKEFTEGVEAIVGLGIKTAIPWLKKTADTTVKAVDLTAAAVDASARAAQEGAEQAKVVYSVFELEQKSQSLEQKSAAQREKAQRIQKEIEALPSKKIPVLQKGKRIEKEDFGTVDAKKILNKFQPDVIPPNLSKDLRALQETEQSLKESVRTTQSTERGLSMAARKCEQTQKRLEEAEKALAKAQKNHADAQNVEAEALAEDTAARNDLKKVEATFEKNREKVRTALSQQQDIYITKTTREMQTEKEELIKSANDLYREAQALMRQARELER